MGKVLRWLLVPLSVVGILLAVVLAGRVVLGIADGFCEEAHRAGGICVEAWHTSVMDALAYGGVFATAFLLATVPALIAPTLRRTVASIGALLLPALALVAWSSTNWPDLLAPFLLALAAALVGLAIIWRRVSRGQGGQSV